MFFQVALLYDGYGQEDFDALLGRLEGIQGKFLLSSFRNASLAEFSGRLGWHTVEVRMSSPITQGKGRTPRQKIGVLIANHPIGAGARGEAGLSGSARARASRGLFRLCGCNGVVHGATLRGAVFSGILDSILWRVQYAKGTWQARSAHDSGLPSVGCIFHKNDHMLGQVFPVPASRTRYTPKCPNSAASASAFQRPSWASHAL